MMSIPEVQDEIWNIEGVGSVKDCLQEEVVPAWGWEAAPVE
jgi:hypothetical protein